MNPEQWLSVIETLIAHKPISGTGTWTLVWHNNGLDLIPTRSLGETEITFGRITAFDAEYGLSTHQWARIKTRLTTFLTQKGLL